MQTIDLLHTTPQSVSVKSLAFEASINALAQALLKLEAETKGPAAVTDMEKLDLVLAHEPALRELEQALEDFTNAGEMLSAEEQATFHAYTHELVHPRMLQSPFAKRCFEKPLGYAGDYVMVRYILGEPLQGDSAFAQLVNFALHQTDVAQGHRNRIKVLEALLSEHAAAAHATNRKARGMTIGCGPAEETYRFITNSEHAGSLDMTLVDFNRETLDWSAARLKRACQETGRSPELTFLEESVVNIARRREESIRPEFDFVICAGLFDYFSDKVCSRVIQFGARALLPGGTLMVTNVSKCASSFSMSKLLEWDLIYRSAEQLDNLIPRWPGLSHKVYVDETGTNVVAEIRRQ